MDREEKKLLEEIRNGLHDFEIQYEEGSWEEFQQMYKKQMGGKQRRLSGAGLAAWKYIAAAAVLVGALILMPWDRSEPTPELNEAIVGIKKTPGINKQLDAPAERAGGMQVDFNRRSRVIESTPENPFQQEEVDHGLPAVPQKPAREPVVVALVLEEATPVQPTTPLKESSPEVPPALWKESPLAAAGGADEAATSGGRWKFGIEINSSLSSDKANLAAGLLTQFQVSDKVRLSTGVSYSTLAAAHESGPVQLSYDTKVVGGETTIKALDIPLTVVYEPRDGWFASVGVSALAVLSEDKILRLESEALQETVILDPESGAAVSLFEVVTNEYTENSTETDFEGRGNLRYLNLSIGKKQRLNERTEILLEPFLKIPMGDLQRKDINLLNSGIKLKLLF